MRRLFADPPLRRLLAGIVATMTAVTIGVAALALIAGFDAIHGYAARSGGIAAHSWMAPLFVDSFVFVGAAAELWRALTRTDATAQGWTARPAGLAPKAPLVIAAAGSYGLNIAHAPVTVSARAVAALPPTALVVTEVILMSVIRGAVRFRLTHLSEAAPFQQGQGHQGASAASAVSLERWRRCQRRQPRGRAREPARAPAVGFWLPTERPARPRMPLTPMSLRRRVDSRERGPRGWAADA